MRTFPAWSFGGLGSAFAGAGIALAPAVAWADEPRNTSEPTVMMESGEVTNVIDAFDDHDAFDINIGLGFEYSSKGANILRETSINAPGLTTGGFTTNLLNVARFSETTSKLLPRVDIGLYKDLAVHVSLPIVLSNSRQLTPLNGSDRNAVAFQGAPGERLFSPSFASPTRSGIEHVAAGLDFNILNQARDLTKPTWVLGFEGRFSIGTPMQACTTKPKQGQIDCANPADINRNGRTDTEFMDLEGVDLARRTPGVSRGTIGLEVHTMMSKRIKYIEPYGGFNALFEFQQAFSDYGLSEFEETLVNHPPFVGSMILGLMVIPWENREKWNRLTFDLRFAGTYHSEGREYAELFDPLGSSDAPSLRNPQWQRYKANPECAGGAGCATPSVVDTSQQSTRTYTTGLSDVQAYGSFRTSASVTWQAGEYVKFQFGAGFRHDQGHGITGDQPCNPAVREIARSGPCKTGDPAAGTVSATGLPNPNYRPTINAVGRRFFVDDSNTFDIFASGVVMF